MGPFISTRFGRAAIVCGSIANSLYWGGKPPTLNPGGMKPPTLVPDVEKMRQDEVDTLKDRIR